MGRIDVQNYEGQLKRELEKLEEAENITKDDKNTLKKFIKHRDASNGRLYSELNRLRYSLNHKLNKDKTLKQICTQTTTFEEINQQITNSSYYHSNYKDSTKDEYRKAWKRLLEYWYRNQGNTSEKVETILPNKYSTNTHSLGQNIDPRKTPSAEDVKQVCRELEAISKETFAKRNVAMCMTLWDLGCRISGLLRMNVEHVKYNNGEIHEVVVPAVKDSPTRPLELTVATPALQYYLENVHPEPENPNAPLWATLKGETRRVNPSDFSQKLRTAKARTGLDIKFNPHNWRRGRGTFVVVKDIFDIRTAATRGGWQDIHTLDGYLQQTMEGVNKKVKNVYNKEKTDTNITGVEADLLPLECLNCGDINSGHRKRCTGCQQMLTDAVPQGAQNSKVDEEMMDEIVDIQSKILEVQLENPNASLQDVKQQIIQEQQ